MTTTNPFVWIEISVDDLPRAQKFYETVLQVELKALPTPGNMQLDEDDENYFEMVAFPGDMMGPGCGGTLVKSNLGKPGPGGTLVYFQSEDCAVSVSRVEPAGGKIVTEKMSLGEYGFCAMAQDTEGNIIGFHSMV
jgi:predicted enzyme related to lactoylglutathione lyase